MKRIALTALAAATVVAAIPAAASAQSSQRHYAPPAYGQAQWFSINSRQRELDRRIDIGVRTGRITRREATALRAEFRQIARLEQTYRRGGLSLRERADLDRRFDRLSAKIRWEVADRDTRRPGQYR